MKKSNSVLRASLLCFVLLTSFTIENLAQPQGYIDDFENGTLEFVWRRAQSNRPPILLWETVTPASYALAEADGVLKIDYSKLEGRGANDKFTFRFFRGMNVTANPRVQLQVRSELETRLCVSPVYSHEPLTLEYLEKEVPGDSKWHTYTFDFTPAYYKKTGRIDAIDFYFDRDTSVEKSGKIEIDNFKLAWQLIYVTDLQASVKEGRNVLLSWKSSDEENVSKYLIYRGSVANFKVDESTLHAETAFPFFSDEDLEPYRHYFYKVIAVHKSGEVYFASKMAHAETYLPGKKPAVHVLKSNGSIIKKYEKFELELGLENIGIENPYDPEDIDVFALFTSPSGKTIRINGFYDNFENADTWKLRFSPGELGSYSYRLFVKDAGGTGESAQASFIATESEHHGWIRPSKVNPHYFSHDDGTSFYGVGVYSPWRNDMDRFDKFSDHKANLFAIWDITYGGFVNGTGLIEEELGRYNQLKLGRIDSMLNILEDKDIQLMYAIWPHDLFSETVWAAQWHQNPYSELCDVDDVYSDPEVWEYQKRKYRYMIARFAHSRSMGIWELINEMNGTDGWAHGREQECYDWVEKCEVYFEENDPYNHPVTASFSGGFSEYREELYMRTDIPNIHVYPAQGWEMNYPDDRMRSAMYNYAWASKRFWGAFEKPAIFGEAGASLAYYPENEPEYHISYHNQIWASLVNGLAATPVWWDYPVLSEADWDQLKHLSEFVADIDLANQPYQPLECASEGVDLYAMGTENAAFGWGRSFESDNISGREFTISGMKEGAYSILWYDCWNGQYFQTAQVKLKKGKLKIKVPQLTEMHQDVAFKVVAGR